MKKLIYGIDFKAEIKEYKKLCSGKKTENNNYCKWERHIEALITERIKKDNNYIENLINLKHLCILRSNSEKNGALTFIPMVTMFITLLLSKFLFVEGENELISYTKIILMSVIVSALVAKGYNSYEYPKNFYHDLSIIVDKKITEAQNEEKEKIKLGINNN
ncbi:MAG: hypothetical protein IJ305_07935 [Oscillospiraceae bacterium]|nr:hypothetical protein [Oscillospiraceae bacterium]